MANAGGQYTFYQSNVDGVQQLHLGWVSGATGAVPTSFPSGFVNVPLGAYQQRNYTSGRLMALELLARHAKPPAWPDSVKLPRRIEAIAQDVAQSFVRQPPA